MNTLRHYIHGSWVESSSSAEILRLSPTTGEPNATIPEGTPIDTERAVQSAASAQTRWAELGLAARLDLLDAAADAIEQNAERLAALETVEMGKPLAVSESFLASGVEAFREAISDARHYSFSERIKVVDGMVTDVERVPVGVVALIVPWNFTNLTILMALGSILAAGNTCVIKPSEKASQSAVGLFEVLDTVGFPPGVVNLLLGDYHSGAPLSEHPGVGLVRFTGSVATGRRVGATAAANLNRAILELGGKDPVVIDDDVDPVATAKAVAHGTFVNSGQICTSMERIYVHEKVAAPFIRALTEAASALVLGDPSKPGVDLGPMVDEGQRSIVHRQVLDARERGADVLVGGELPDGPGFFYPPTVVVNVQDEMEIMTAETFGPVAAVKVVPDFRSGVEEARKTDFGLGATIYTHRPENVRLAHSIPTGILWVNEWQGGDFGRQAESAGASGMGAGGGPLAYDAVTRPMAVHYRVDAEPGEVNT